MAFESRNPQARAWEQWIRSATYERIDSPYGPMECWLDLVGVTGSLVHFQGYNRFLDTGEQLVVDSQLRFRSQTELTTSLSEAGFVVEHLYGNWQRGPMSEKSRVMIFVAQRK